MKISTKGLISSLTCLALLLAANSSFADDTVNIPNVGNVPKKTLEIAGGTTAGVVAVGSGAALLLRQRRLRLAAARAGQERLRSARLDSAADDANLNRWGARVVDPNEGSEIFDYANDVPAKGSSIRFRTQEEINEATRSAPSYQSEAADLLDPGRPIISPTAPKHTIRINPTDEELGGADTDEIGIRTLISRDHLEGNDETFGPDWQRQNYQEWESDGDSDTESEASFASNEARDTAAAETAQVNRPTVTTADANSAINQRMLTNERALSNNLQFVTNNSGDAEQEIAASNELTAAEDAGSGGSGSVDGEPRDGFEPDFVPD